MPKRFLHSYQNLDNFFFLIYSDLISKLDFFKDVDYSEIESPEELFSYKLSDEEKRNL